MPDPTNSDKPETEEDSVIVQQRRRYRALHPSLARTTVSKSSAIDILNEIQAEQASKSSELIAKQRDLLALLKAGAKPAGSMDPNGWDPVMAHLKAKGQPVTREAYLAYSYPDGIPDPWTGELESMLPAELRET